MTKARRYVMKRARWMRRGAMFLCAFFLVPALSFAQQYPARPVTIVVASQTGSGLDISIRALASKSEKFLGQPFVISAKAAGGGTVALIEMMKQRADGYNLIMTSTTPLTFAPNFRKMPYTLEDYTYIASFARGRGPCLLVRTDSGWNTFKDFIEYARKNPGKIKYGTSGVNTTKHIGMEFIAKKEGIKWVHVPLEGDTAGITNLLGGHIQATPNGSPAYPHVQNGSFRILAFFGSEQHERFPDVPNLIQLGYNFKDDALFVIAAPKGVPPAVVEKLENTFRRGMENPEVKQVLEKLDLKVNFANSRETKGLLEEARAMNAKMAADLNIIPE
jgi:tripartite-type tricarboxylate transporter receptor subunit TctC